MLVKKTVRWLKLLVAAPLAFLAGLLVSCKHATEKEPPIICDPVHEPGPPPEQPKPAPGPTVAPGTPSDAPRSEAADKSP
jgi:hypothetical protein